MLFLCQFFWCLLIYFIVVLILPCLFYFGIVLTLHCFYTIGWRLEGNITCKNKIVLFLQSSKVYERGWPKQEAKSIEYSFEWFSVSFFRKISYSCKRLTVVQKQFLYCIDNKTSYILLMMNSGLSVVSFLLISYEVCFFRSHV